MNTTKKEFYSKQADNAIKDFISDFKWSSTKLEESENKELQTFDSRSQGSYDNYFSKDNKVWWKKTYNTVIGEENVELSISRTYTRLGNDYEVVYNGIIIGEDSNLKVALMKARNVIRLFKKI